jgi:hypothetical protein
MAYAAIANVVLVLLLAAITTYYAWHAKRQADASHQEVAASKRQAAIAQQTLDFLLRQSEQQRQIDLSTVSFNLEAAIHMVDQWQTRIRSDSYPQLPDVIELRPTNFASFRSPRRQIRQHCRRAYGSGSALYFGGGDKHSGHARCEPRSSAKLAEAPRESRQRARCCQIQARLRQNASAGIHRRRATQSHITMTKSTR